LSITVVSDFVFDVLRETNVEGGALPVQLVYADLFCHGQR
jgi:hypothetical protein